MKKIDSDNVVNVYLVPVCMPNYDATLRVPNLQVSSAQITVRCATIGYHTGSKHWTPVIVGEVPAGLEKMPSIPNNSNTKVQYLDPVRYYETVVQAEHLQTQEQQHTPHAPKARIHEHLISCVPLRAEDAAGRAARASAGAEGALARVSWESAGASGTI